MDELRASIMLLFPCPPLPMIGSRENGEEIIDSSHNLLAKLMDFTARCDNEAANEFRRSQQEQLTSKYIQDLRECKSEDDLWKVQTMFTRRYMQSYFDRANDVCFIPMCHTPPSVIVKVRAWLTGREILGGNTAANVKFHDHKHASELYSDCKAIVLKNPKSLIK